MDGKVFSKENKEFLTRTCDEVVKLPFYAEPFDGIVFTFIINWVDVNADKVVPDIFDKSITQIVDAVELKDWDSAINQTADVVNMLVDIPYLNEETEKQIFIDVFKLVIDLVKLWIENRKKAEEVVPPVLEGAMPPLTNIEQVPPNVE